MKKVILILVMGLLASCANYNETSNIIKQNENVIQFEFDIWCEFKGTCEALKKEHRERAAEYCGSLDKYAYDIPMSGGGEYKCRGPVGSRGFLYADNKYRRPYWTNYNPSKNKQLKRTSLASKKNTCEEIGFKPSTEASANCILRLMEIEEARLNRASQQDIAATQSLIEQEIAKKSRDQEAWKVLLGLTSGINSGGSNISSGTTSCFKSSETTSGIGKICYYSCMGSTKALNVSSMAICPLSANF